MYFKQTDNIKLKVILNFKVQQILFP